MLTIEGIIAIISAATASIAIVIKLISIACFKSKCFRFKCCCIEVERDVKNESGNLTFDENNNQVPVSESKQQDIHININEHHNEHHSELKESHSLPIRKPKNNNAQI